MANIDYIDKANLMGSAHWPTTFQYELLTGKKLDLIKSTMLPFGPVIMALLWGIRADLDSTTKRDIIRHTYKVIGPSPQLHTRPVSKLVENGNVTKTHVSGDTTV